MCPAPVTAAAAAKSLQSCPTLCNPRDGSPLGSPVPGILQARTLESVAISFSKAWKWKLKVKSLSCVWLLVTPWTAAYQGPPSMGFSRQEYWSGVPSPSPPVTVCCSIQFSGSVVSNSLCVDVTVILTTVIRYDTLYYLHFMIGEAKAHMDYITLLTKLEAESQSNIFGKTDIWLLDINKEPRDFERKNKSSL